MQSTSTLRYLRIAPRKVRLVADLIKGKNVAEAKAILKYATKGAAEPLQKTLQSAIAGATHNLQLQEGNLYVSKVTVSEGPKLKRYRPRARGRAYPIQKKTSHITVIVDEIAPSAEASVQKKRGSKTPIAAVKQEGTAGPGKKEAAKAKFRAQKEVASSKGQGVGKRIFRRKTV